MFITVAGTPAGYGYFDITATPNENIIPAMVAEIRRMTLTRIWVRQFRLAQWLFRLKQQQRLVLMGEILCW